MAGRGRRLTLALALAHQQEPGRVRVDALLSVPLLRAEWPDDDGPRLVIEEATTTVALCFLCPEDLIAFQHNLAHLAIPSGLRR